MRKQFATFAILLSCVAGCAPTAVKFPATMPVERSDWIELTSGEWLKGRVKSMQQWVVDFDSDKLNELSLDWDDVNHLYMPRASIRYGDHVLTGALAVDPSGVTLTGAQDVQIPRSDLLAISRDGVKERDYWSGNLDLGVTVRTGNTNQTEVTAQANAQRRTPKSRFTLSYIGNYDLTESEETTNNDRVTGSFDLAITPKFFIRPFGGQYYHDTPLNIEHQATVSAGVGYFILDRPHLTWDVFAGPAYQYTRFENTEPGKSSDASTPAAVFQTSFDKKLTQRLELMLTWQGILTSNDAGLFTSQTVGTLRFKITHLLHLDLSLTWNRTEQPQADASGKVPKRDDFQTVLSIGVNF